MSPYTEDLESSTDEVLSMARKRQPDWSKFKKMLQRHPDLMMGCRWPETEEDICVSMVLRILNDHIFQTSCYGLIDSYTDVVQFIERNLEMTVEPKRGKKATCNDVPRRVVLTICRLPDLFAVRSWSSEAYNAIYSAKEFNQVRSKARQRLTGHLGDVFRVFCQKERMDWFYHGFETECVTPAMALYEKLQCSVHHYYLDISPYIVWSPGSSQTQVEASPEFIDSIRDLNCCDLLKNRKAFNLNKMDPAPSKADLYENMTNVCTLAPALFMRQIGRRDAIKERVLVRRQQMLVAWGNEEKKREYKARGNLLGSLLRFKPERTVIGGVDSLIGGFAARWG
jgi:hypothetical protein